MAYNLINHDTIWPLYDILVLTRSGYNMLVAETILRWRNWNMNNKFFIRGDIAIGNIEAVCTQSYKSSKLYGLIHYFFIHPVFYLFLKLLNIIFF